MQDQRIDTLVTTIETLDRPGLVKMLRNLDCDFAMDFTDEFLGTISLDRLKHIVLAAGLHAHRVNSAPA